MDSSQNSKLPPNTVRNRLAEIRDACGYDSLDDLGSAINESRAVVSAWQNRNTYGRNGALKLHDITGAALDWLSARGDVAFPSGPKMNPKLSVAKLYGDVTELRKQMAWLAIALVETKRDAAEAWYAKLNESDSESYRSKGFRGLLLGLLQSALASAAQGHESAQRVQARQARGQGMRK